MVNFTPTIFAALLTIYLSSTPVSAIPAPTANASPALYGLASANANINQNINTVRFRPYYGYRFGGRRYRILRYGFFPPEGEEQQEQEQEEMQPAAEEQAEEALEKRRVEDEEDLGKGDIFEQPEEEDEEGILEARSPEAYYWYGGRRGGNRNVNTNTNINTNINRIRGGRRRPPFEDEAVEGQQEGTIQARSLDDYFLPEEEEAADSAEADEGALEKRDAQGAFRRPMPRPMPKTIPRPMPMPRPRPRPYGIRYPPEEEQQQLDEQLENADAAEAAGEEQGALEKRQNFYGGYGRRYGRYHRGYYRHRYGRYGRRYGRYGRRYGWYGRRYGWYGGYPPAETADAEATLDKRDGGYLITPISNANQNVNENVQNENSNANFDEQEEEKELVTRHENDDDKDDNNDNEHDDKIQAPVEGNIIYPDEDEAISTAVDSQDAEKREIVPEGEEEQDADLQSEPEEEGKTLEARQHRRFRHRRPHHRRPHHRRPHHRRPHHRRPHHRHRRPPVEGLEKRDDAPEQYDEYAPEQYDQYELEPEEEMEKRDIMVGRKMIVAARPVSSIRVSSRMRMRPAAVTYYRPVRVIRPPGEEAEED